MKGVKVLVTSCRRDLDSMWLGFSRKSSVVGQQEGGGGRNAVSKFRRGVSMNIMTIEREATS